jgi:hypothetical protein
MLGVSKVSRSLDRKTLIMWLEIMDIFILVTFCSVLNLVFSGTGLKLYFVYLPTLVLGATLVVAKWGKPEKFLIHFLKFHLQPKHLTCFHSGPDEFSLSVALDNRRKGIFR